MIENSSIWIVSDVDGTLMDHSYDLSPARETIKKLQNHWFNILKIFHC